MEAAHDHSGHSDMNVECDGSVDPLPKGTWKGARLQVHVAASSILRQRPMQFQRLLLLYNARKSSAQSPAAFLALLGMVLDGVFWRR